MTDLLKFRLTTSEYLLNLLQGKDTFYLYKIIVKLILINRTEYEYHNLFFNIYNCINKL